MKNNFIDNRQIRVFISSTFQDMQDEREYLFNYIFPYIQRVSENRDVRFTVIDLRWGITYEESANGKVMEICFEEINNCRPYFIGILGDRYGWCPDINELQKNPNIDYKYPWVKDLILKGTSVTEMEMQYGALCKELQPLCATNAAFFIKEDTEETSQLQKELKQQVRDNIIYPSYSYNSVEELGRQVEENLLKLLDKHYPKEMCSGFRKEYYTQTAAMHNLSYGIIPRKSVTMKLNSFLTCSNRYLVLHGEKNCGKTSFLAHWINNEKALTEYDVIYYFIDECEHSDTETYKQYIINYFEKELHIDIDEETKKLDFGRLTYNITRDHHILFVIDGVNKFENEYINTSEYLPMIQSGSKVIVSATTDSYRNSDCANVQSESCMIAIWEHPDIFDDFQYYLDFQRGSHYDNPVLIEYKEQDIVVPLYTKKEIAYTLTSTFRRYGKKLTESQIDVIKRDAKSKDPFLLNLLVDSIIYLRTPEDLEDHINKYHDFVNPYDFFCSIIIGYEKIYGKELVKDFACYISISRRGIPENDLLNMLKIDQIHFSQLYNGLRILTRTKSGYIVFANCDINYYIDTYYKEVEKEKYRKNIIDYYLSRNNYQTNCVNRDSWMWKFELPYQCEKLSLYDDLYYVIKQPQVALAELHELSYDDHPEYYCGEVKDYWDKLISKGLYSLDVYFDNSQNYLSFNPLSIAYFVEIARCLLDKKRTLDYARRALAIYFAYRDKYIPAILLVYMIMAMLYDDKSEEKEKILLQVLQICKDSLFKGNVSCYVANIVKELSDLYDESVNKQKNLYETIFDLLNKVDDKKGYLHLFHEVLLKLAYIYKNEGQYDLALDRIVTATEISKEYCNKTLDGYHILVSNYAFDEYTCASILNVLNRIEEAKWHVKVAFDIYNSKNNELIQENIIESVNKLHTELFNL